MQQNRESMRDEYFYGIAAQEIAQNKHCVGLMAKAYASALGDADKTKAFYIAMRASQLIDDYKANQKLAEEKEQAEKNAQNEARAQREKRAKELRFREEEEQAQREQRGRRNDSGFIVKSAEWTPRGLK
jgi:hypothetical protein